MSVIPGPSVVVDADLAPLLLSVLVPDICALRQRGARGAAERLAHFAAELEQLEQLEQLRQLDEDGRMAARGHASEAVTCEMSPAGHDDAASAASQAPSSVMSTDEAAARLSLSARQMRRVAREQHLGEVVGGGLVLQRDRVEAYAATRQPTTDRT